MCRPGWPGNQGKCSGLLSYCADYVEDRKKGLVDRPFFIEKVSYSQVFWTGVLSLTFGSNDGERKIWDTFLPFQFIHLFFSSKVNSLKKEKNIVS